LVSTNIPFYRLLIPEFKAFIEKYTQFKVPDPSTLWRYHLKDVYNSVISYIREKLSEEYIWISVDETTDCMGRYVVVVIVGSINMDKDKNLKFILNMEFVKKADNFTVVQSVNNALLILWPEGIQYHKVLLLLSDAAPYMKLAGKTLRNIFPKLIHLTCMAHALHNVCEK